MIIRPTVVVGLGGTGKTVLLSLKRMIAENSPQGLKDFPFLRFLSLDTDIDVPTYSSSIQALNTGELTLDPVRETYGLGSNWNNRPDLDAFPTIQEWFPGAFQSKLTAADFKMGAGQSKPLGRFAMAWNANDVYSRLQTQMSHIVTVNNTTGFKAHEIDKGLNVFVCGSLCGGTGAGTFIDVAYMIRHIATGLNLDLNLYGMFALSTLFDSMTGGSANIKSNCFASLLELDYFMTEQNYENELRNYRPAFNNFSQAAQYATVARNRVFDYPFLFDKSNERGISLGGSADLAEMIARFIFLLTGSEASTAYRSVDSNIMNTHDALYRNLLGKPIRYRTMGTFSVVFPKRMVRQLLGYRLSEEVLKVLLDDSYPPVMVQNLMNRFLRDHRFHPAGNLRDRLDSFTANGEAPQSWTAHVEEEWESLVNGEGGTKSIPVAEWAGRLRELQSGLERDFEEYRKQAMIGNRRAAEEFSETLDHELGELLDLRMQPDPANSNTPTRGSLRRAAELLDAMVKEFQSAKASLKTRQSEAAERVKDSRMTMDDLREDIQGMARGLLGVKSRANKALEELGKTLIDHYQARQDEFVSEQLFSFIAGQRDAVRDERGVLGIIEDRARSFAILKNNLIEVQQGVALILAQNRGYTSGELVKALFNYDRDVTRFFEAIWTDADKGKDFLLGEMGNELKEETVFGPSYGRAGQMQAAALLTRILSKAEAHFTEAVEAVNIEELILGDPQVLEAFRGKNYHGNANLFLNIDSTEMAKEGINRETNQFYAISIPGERYKSAPCAPTKGDLHNHARKCPAEADSNLNCPHLGHCLKQVLLPTLERDAALIETEEGGEVNFLKTLVGYPLHALSTSMICKGSYDEQREASRRAGKPGETIHMFGDLYFASVFDATPLVVSESKRFVDRLVLAAALRVAVIKPLSIDFFTAEDNQFKRAEPSLHLGKGLDDAKRRSQSSRRSDVEALQLFHKDFDYYLDRVLGNAEQRAKAEERIGQAYLAIKSRTPESPFLVFAATDAEALRDFSIKQFNRDIEPPKEEDSYR